MPKIYIIKTGNVSKKRLIGIAYAILSVALDSGVRSVRVKLDREKNVVIESDH